MLDVACRGKRVYDASVSKSLAHFQHEVACRMALTLLRREERALHALCQAFERGDGLRECVLAIENATTADIKI